MIEQAKWQKELVVFNRLVNTIVLTGNINDQYAVIDENPQKIIGFTNLDFYLARCAYQSGYQSVICYDPVDGFHTVTGTPNQSTVLDELERLAQTVRSEEKSSQAPVLPLTKHRYSDGSYSLLPASFSDAAHLIYLLLTASSYAVCLIMDFSSRLAARPDDLDIDERMIFMYLQNGAAHAASFRVNQPSNSQNQSTGVIRNQLYLIADKLNDLPAWYSLSHPSLKSINIPKPDYRMRGQIISCYASSFPGYQTATPDERKQFCDTFVGSTENFTVRDLILVFQIASQNCLDIHRIDKAILLYKHGIQDNPWLKLDTATLQHAEETIKKRVLGQDPVVRAAVDIVKRSAMGMSGLQHSGASSKPRGILFLAGPTGTGKTELAKALTELIFLDERNMIRFDMSEYRQEQSDQRLLGAPPGYVGYEAGGQLTNAVREHPFSVLLFDEIEKCHPSILDKFLQILEDGRITDGRGETVYFQDTLIIFTSNLGITVPSPTNPAVRIENVSYEKDTSYESVKAKVLQGVKQYFNVELGRPELLNRIGNNILVFDFIRESSLMPILQKQIGNISRNLWNEKHIRLTITRDAMFDLFQFAKADLPKGKGGRGIGNMVEEMFINPLSRYLFDNGILQNASVEILHISRVDGSPVITARPQV